MASIAPTRVIGTWRVGAMLAIALASARLPATRVCATIEGAPFFLSRCHGFTH
ncbi:MAG: hypothetical protein M3Z24_05685 [Chloroflexota bacterium]|nr:hypothetical protein [Chloroflexota bacterium]